MHEHFSEQVRGMMNKKNGRTLKPINKLSFCNCHLTLFICISLSLINTGSTELNASAPNKVALEHFEMNTNDAYGTNTAMITTKENVAYMTTGDTIPATQNVAYGQVPPGTDDCYDYVV